MERVLPKPPHLVHLLKDLVVMGRENSRLNRFDLKLMLILWKSTNCLKTLKICLATMYLKNCLLDTPIFVAVLKHIKGSECCTVETATKVGVVKQMFLDVVVRQILNVFPQFGDFCSTLTDLGCDHHYTGYLV